MTIKQLEQKQDELDNEELDCPNCSNKTAWGEYKETGTCCECYYKAWKKRKKRKATN